MNFIDICEAALCTPDFAVIHHIDPDEQASWLRHRASKFGTSLTIEEVEAAIEEWDNRERGETHHIATIRLDDLL